MFTDHRNLLFVFAPLALSPALGRHVVSKVQRWALFLSQFEYVIEHIERHRNIFADMLTRWARGNRATAPVARIGLRACSLVLSSPQGSPGEQQDSPDWPSRFSIQEAQARHIRSCPSRAVVGVDGLRTVNGLIWIPPDEELTTKIIVASHAGLNGHRGREARESIIRETFVWKTLARDVK